MTIRHLKTFIMVAQTESITKAANELHVAQPSVTQTIKELENYYNVELFNRINKKIVITEEGLSLLAKAKEIIDDFKDFEDIANDKQSNPVIRIGATLTFGKNFIPSFVKMIKEKYPNIDLYVCMDETNSLEEKILKGDLDFVLCEGLTSSKDITSTIIKKDRLVVAARTDYNIPDSITFKDLVNYDLLLRDNGSTARRQIDNIASKYGIKLRPLIDSVSNYTIVTSTLKGIGIAILPYPIVRDYINQGTMKEIKLDCNLERNLYIIRLNGKIFSGLKRTILNQCLKHVKEFNEIYKNN